MERIAVMGGDGRQRYAAAYLRRLGYCVRTWGLFPEDPADWHTVLPADAVLLPLPAAGERPGAGRQAPAFPALLPARPRRCNGYTRDHLPSRCMADAAALVMLAILTARSMLLMRLSFR